MKIQHTIAFALTLILTAEISSATVINFDENGKGTITPPSGVVFPLVSLGNQPDPFDPANGLLPLVYDLTASGITLPVVPGDMNVIEVAGTPPSDLVRWTTNAAALHNFLVVYSDRAETGELPDLADVGLPTLRQTNLVTFNETGPEGGPNGVFGYAPTPNQPGFFINSANDTPTYNFISDGAVPEPASAGLLLLGAGSLLARARRRH